MNKKYKRGLRRKFLNLTICLIAGTLLGCIIGGVMSFLDKRSGVSAADKVPESRLTVEENDPVVSETASGEDTGKTDIAPPLGVTSVRTVDILAVGDNLIHSGIYKSGLKADGTYNFDHLYEHVKDDILAADLAIVNQETIYTNNRNDYSGYPCFAGPVEIGDALANAGFDVVLHATNHVYDRGVQGITDTLDFWKTKHPEITVLGIHESQADADTIKTVTVNDITFAMLNYTYGMNGFSLPADQPYLVDLLDKEKVAADIAKAKEISDCVIFFLHCGNEYVYEPAAETKEWVQFLLDQGVDITIGSHPHVLEPYTELTREDGHKMVVYYSMGNFISTQDEYPRMIGGMAKLTVEKRGSGENAQITVKNYTLDPLYTHYNHTAGVYTVYKLSDYTESLASQHEMYNKYEEPVDIERIKNKFNEIMTTPINQPGHDYTMAPAEDAA